MDLWKIWSVGDRTLVDQEPYPLYNSSGPGKEVLREMCKAAVMGPEGGRKGCGHKPRNAYYPQKQSPLDLRGHMALLTWRLGLLASGT